MLGGAVAAVVAGLMIYGVTACKNEAPAAGTSAGNASPPAGGTTDTSTTISGTTGTGTTISGTTASGAGPGQSTPSTGVVVVVTDAASLQRALALARPETTIRLSDGVYRGKDASGKEPGRFVASASGTAAAPIVLTGSRDAVLDGGGTGGGYALHLDGARYWKLVGFTVRSAAKGIVLDHSDFNVLDGLHVTDIGAEGIHFRASSSDNRLTNSTVDHTGVRSPNYGEGVYIGSAVSNWPTYTEGQPDRSDRNQIDHNTIVDTGAENLDLKEGSSNGVVRDNDLGGDRIASKNSADSWIDVKGNGYLVEGNRGTTAPRPGATRCGDPTKNADANPFCDGIQVHVVIPGWGEGNTFARNVLAVNAPGAGIWLQNTAVGLHNVVSCDNLITGAAAGAIATNHYSALSCTP